MPSSLQYVRMPSLIHTYTGRLLDPLALNPKDVCIEDVAHALANQCRFSGHVREFYSVAEHCVRASYIVPVPIAFDALMHDGAEAYLQDMAKPLKNHPRLGQAYRAAERRIEFVLGDVFGVTFPFLPEVKVADERMLITEARDLLHGTEGWPSQYASIAPLPDVIVPWNPKKAERRFLARYTELTEGGD